MPGWHIRFEIRMSVAKLPVLALKKNEERRLLAGHLWVYSNEVDTRKTPLSAFEPGGAVTIQSASGRSLGTGYINPHSLICARLVSRRAGAVFDEDFFVQRLQTALALRETFYPQPYYRLVYGEGDSLPGLIVDRYGEVLVMQITTAGMERCKADILGALHRVLDIKGVLLRNDTPVRELEKLDSTVETLGEVPASVQLEEGGVRFEVPLGEGQKTGWFFDQRGNQFDVAFDVLDDQRFGAALHRHRSTRRKHRSPGGSLTLLDQFRDLVGLGVVDLDQTGHQRLRGDNPLSGAGGLIPLAGQVFQGVDAQDVALPFVIQALGL